MSYPLPEMLISGFSGREGRFVDRLAAGTHFARISGYSDVTIRLTAEEFKLFRKALPGAAAGKPLIFDGALVENSYESAIKAKGRHNETVTIPLMTDAECIAQLRLVPGQFVVFEKRLVPYAVEAMESRSDRVLINGKPYDAGTGKAAGLTGRRIDYVWDKDAMERKADANLLTDMEKAFFAALLSKRSAA